MISVEVKGGVLRTNALLEGVSVFARGDVTGRRAISFAVGVRGIESSALATGSASGLFSGAILW